MDPAEEIGIDTLTEEAPAEDVEGLQGEAVTAEAIDEEDSAAESDGSISPVASEAEPEEVPPAAPDTASDDGLMSYLPYIFGALVLGIVGFVFARRRGNGADEVESTPHTAPAEDVFSDVQLKQQSMEVAAPEIKKETEQEEPASAEGDSRGYGERKHDEYASDVDASDALAEADIYIAYGRHPQAIDLLNNALNTEPTNPVYRLKLLEIYNELKDHDAAAAQLIKIRASGDPDSIARAESLMPDAVGEYEGAQQPVETVSPPELDDAPGLSPNPLDLTPGSEETLESDFSGLEIEEPSVADEEESDLDLSSDFVAGDADGFEEELVIADDSNGLSTKLDLARAYLDMGDDDGARQILDEVVAEGSEELKIEARALLDRIGS